MSNAERKYELYSFKVIPPDEQSANQSKKRALNERHGNNLALASILL